MINVKDYLSSIRYTEQEIKSYVQQKEQLKDSLYIKTSTLRDDKVQESGGKYDDKYIKYIELCEHINEKIDELFDLKLTISNQIDKIENPERRLILRLRYINLLSFEQIAVQMGYEIRNIHRIHGNALNDFETCHDMSVKVM